MANAEHVAKLKEGVEAWNEWRLRNSSTVEQRPPNYPPVDLSGAHLNGVDLTGANLCAADFRDADLGNANLDRADLSGAILKSANLCMANLRWADLINANLNRSDLTGSNLTGADAFQADFREANLTKAALYETNLNSTNMNGAILTKARFGGTLVIDVDLLDTIGLETLEHRRPSPLAPDWLLDGRMPEVFLRGCGVSESLITYLPSLREDPIQFYSCFISYSQKDDEFARRLNSRLRDEHLRVWFAPEELKAGRKIHEAIDQAIRIYDKLLIVLSEASMSSEWVKTEIANARQKELNTGKRVLFPIRLVDFDTIKRWKAFDADTGKDSACEIREYYIPDFSNWKDHDRFATEFAKLLEALKKEDVAGSES